VTDEHDRLAAFVENRPQESRVVNARFRQATRELDRDVRDAQRVEEGRDAAPRGGRLAGGAR
jgi:hypothetical protein